MNWWDDKKSKYICRKLNVSIRRNVAHVGSFECRGVKGHLDNTSWGLVAQIARVSVFVYICLCNEGNLRVLEAIQFLHTVTVLHESIFVCSAICLLCSQPSFFSTSDIAMYCGTKCSYSIFCLINMLQCIFSQRQRRCYHCSGSCLTCIMWRRPFCFYAHRWLHSQQRTSVPICSTLTLPLSFLL